MVPDYHTHTRLCRHAVGETRDYRAAAAVAGLPGICFADHAPSEEGHSPHVRMDVGQFDEYRALVDEAREGEGPEVMFGIEADYYEGCEASLGEWLPDQRFDLVLGSIHFIGDWAFDDPNEIATWETVDVGTAWRQYLVGVTRLVDSGMYDIVAHLDLPKKFGHRITAEDTYELFSPVLDRIAEKGMAIEINTSGLRKPAGEIYPSPQILTMACERNIAITFGSDAHAPEDVGADFGRAISLARAAGYTSYARFHQRNQVQAELPQIAS